MARIIWRADFDPGTLRAEALPADPADPASLVLAPLAPWMSVAVDGEGREHAVLSDGMRRVRLDITDGSLSGCEAVVLRFQQEGLQQAKAAILPLQRLISFVSHHRFAASLYPKDRGSKRLIVALRVYDGLAQGASQREIAAVLFGARSIEGGWRGASDSMRSRLRRLVADARRLAGGEYRSLLGGGLGNRRHK